MGLVLLMIFCLVLVGTSVIALILIVIVGKTIKLDPLKIILFTSVTIIMIGIISFYSISNIDGAGNTVKGLEQVNFYVVVFASSPLIGIASVCFFYVS